MEDKPAVAQDLKESVQDRAARLKKQRDLIVKQKQEKLNLELQEAREGQSDNKYSNNLLKDLLAIDKKVNQQEQKKKKVAMPKEDVLEVDNFEEDDEAQPMDKPKNQPKAVKKDMKSLFADSDDEEETKKQEELKARQERQRNVMKQLVKEGN